MLGHDLYDVFHTHYTVVAKNRREVDVTLISDVSRSIHSAKPDYVVNATGYTKVEEAEDDKDEAMRVNSEALKNLATVCGDSGAVLVHYSTDFVFDGRNSTPYKEDDEPCPINSYGRSKLLGENEVITAGCEYLIIRTQWLFGPHGKNFVFAIVDRLKKERKISVVDDQIGCPTYTVDLAEATMKLIGRNQRGIFHFSGEGEVSWYGFATRIAELSIPEDVEITPVKSSEFSLKAPRPPYSVLSKEKYTMAVQETPRIWDEMLREFLRRTFESGVAW